MMSGEPSAPFAEDSAHSSSDGYSAFLEVLKAPSKEEALEILKTSSKEEAQPTKAQSEWDGKKSWDEIVDEENKARDEITQNRTGITADTSDTDPSSHSNEGKVAAAPASTGYDANARDAGADAAVAVVPGEGVRKANDGNDNVKRAPSRSDTAISDKRPMHSEWMNFASLCFFIIGSVLYLATAILDYRWAHELLTLPVWLRTADDDEAWMNYRIEERYNASLLEGLLGGGGAEGAEAAVDIERSGGARRMRTRQHYREHPPYQLEKESVGEITWPSVSSSVVERWLRKVTWPSVSSSRTERRLQTPEELYYDECWADLPSEIQDAYALLGHNEDIWDNGGTAETDDYDWEELSDEQREAAEFIGYTEEIWCADEGGGDGGDGGSEPAEPVVTASPVTSSPTGRPTLKPVTDSPTRAPTDRPVTSSPTKEPTPKPVTDSPTKRPTPNPVTGSPTKRPTPNPVTGTPTKEPTPKPVTDSPTERPTPEPITDEPTKKPTPEPVPDALYWHQLSEEQKNSLGMLGFTENAWNLGETSPVESKPWSEMTSEEKFGAFFLGYSAETWDVKGAGEKFPFRPPPLGEGNMFEGLVGLIPPPTTSAPVMAPVGAPKNPFDDLVGLIPKPTTKSPTEAPVPAPTTESPTEAPVPAPTTGSPTEAPFPAPTSAPTAGPTAVTVPPTTGPTGEPTQEPTSEPSKTPTKLPSLSPTSGPSRSPVTATPTTAAPVPGPSLVIESPTAPTNPVPTSPSSPSAPATDPQAATPKTPEELYYDEYWKDLPPEIQAAYSLLGHNETVWNKGLPAATDTTDWEDLSDEQREAALSIGYTEEIWCTTVAPTASPTSSNKPTSTAPDIPPGPTPEEKYYDEYWKDLPPDIRSAFGVLGYNETAWNNGIEPPSNEMDWNDLTREQQNAALLIGYTQWTWDNTIAPTASPIALPDEVMETTVPAGYYDDFDWAEMEPHIQDAAAVLGYDENLWDNDGVSWSDDYDWEELNEEQKEAAALLGYDQVSWDAEDSVALPANQTDAANDIETTVPAGYYDDFDWAELPPDVQDAATVLGYDQELWDASGASWSDDYDWEELNQEQREAAALLGYDQQSWDAEDPLAPSANGTDSVSGMETTVPAGYYDEFDWAELPPDVQEAATALGFNQELWDSDGESWSDDYDWEELNQEQKEAAALLGYDQTSWDEDDPLAALRRDYVSEDDDYVFQVGPADADIWVSTYQILYFLAALSFVIVGFLDLVRERRAFHILMIFAGLFGVLSAVYVEEEVRLSNVLNSVSVHFFLLESITLFGDHKRSAVTVEAGAWMTNTIMIGDLSFGLGALIDVVLSYFYLFDTTADWDTSLMAASIAGASLWLLCSFIYMGAFIYDRQEAERSFDAVDSREDGAARSRV